MKINHEVEPQQKIVSCLKPQSIAAKLQSAVNSILLIDSRPSPDFTAAHVQSSVNICRNNLLERRLQKKTLCIRAYLQKAHNVDINNHQEVVVYDDNSSEPCTFTSVLINKFKNAIEKVTFMSGGFSEFHTKFPDFCVTNLCNFENCHTLPASPVVISDKNGPPSKITSYLYIGSYENARDEKLMNEMGISHILNVSKAAKPDWIPDDNYLQISIEDNHRENILDHFEECFRFIDRVETSSKAVLVHCMAGISRSATVTVGFLMYKKNFTCDQAYQEVKQKRPSISPNLNFLGQLITYEERIRNKLRVTTQPAPVISRDEKTSSVSPTKIQSARVLQCKNEYGSFTGVLRSIKSESSLTCVENGERNIDFVDVLSLDSSNVEHDLYAKQPRFCAPPSNELIISAT